MNTLNQTLQNHLQAAEDDGRQIADGEARLIEVLASMPTEAPTTVDEKAREAIAELRNALRPFAEHGRVLRSRDPSAAGWRLVYDEGRHMLVLGDFDLAMKLLEPAHAD